MQFCLMAGWFVPDEALTLTEEEMWIALTGVVEQNVCWAEFM